MNSTEKWRAYYSPVGRIRMLAGNPALDLANTLHWRNGELLDFVPDYASLVGWCVPALLLRESERRELLKRAKKSSLQATLILKQWNDLRATLKSWLHKIDGYEPKERGVSKNVREMTELLAKLRKIGRGAQFGDLLSIEGDMGEPPVLELPLLRSALEIWRLLEFPPTAIVRQCQADRCGGFFLDESRTKPRRWCSMDSCGNRAKAARHRKKIEDLI
ncbi:MAG: CGNR zinc finger domain-containing protein [Aestuariivirga sp.]